MPIVGVLPVGDAVADGVGEAVTDGVGVGRPSMGVDVTVTGLGEAAVVGTIPPSIAIVLVAEDGVSSISSEVNSSLGTMVLGFFTVILFATAELPSKRELEPKPAKVAEMGVFPLCTVLAQLLGVAAGAAYWVFLGGAFCCCSDDWMSTAVGSGSSMTIMVLWSARAQMCGVVEVMMTAEWAAATRRARARRHGQFFLIFKLYRTSCFHGYNSPITSLSFFFSPMDLQSKQSSAEGKWCDWRPVWLVDEFGQVEGENRLHCGWSIANIYKIVSSKPKQLHFLAYRCWLSILNSW